MSDSLYSMELETGFEPATCGLRSRRSTCLSYSSIVPLMRHQLSVYISRRASMRSRYVSGFSHGSFGAGPAGSISWPSRHSAVVPASHLSALHRLQVCLCCMVSSTLKEAAWAAAGQSPAAPPTPSDGPNRRRSSRTPHAAGPGRRSGKTNNHLIKTREHYAVIMAQSLLLSDIVFRHLRCALRPIRPLRHNAGRGSAAGRMY